MPRILDDIFQEYDEEFIEPKRKAEAAEVKRQNDIVTEQNRNRDILFSSERLKFVKLLEELKPEIISHIRANWDSQKAWPKLDLIQILAFRDRLVHFGICDDKILDDEWDYDIEDRVFKVDYPLLSGAMMNSPFFLGHSGACLFNGSSRTPMKYRNSNQVNAGLALRWNWSDILVIQAFDVDMWQILLDSIETVRSEFRMIEKKQQEKIIKQQNEFKKQQDQAKVHVKEMIRTLGPSIKKALASSSVLDPSHPYLRIYLDLDEFFEIASRNKIGVVKGDKFYFNHHILFALEEEGMAFVHGGVHLNRRMSYENHTNLSLDGRATDAIHYLQRTRDFFMFEDNYCVRIPGIQFEFQVTTK